jgi:SAM-dependent methyltransferase
VNREKTVNRNAETVASGYARIASTYHAHRVEREAVNVQWLDGLRPMLPQSGKVIDLGCGAGVPITRYFATRGYDVTGYDLSEEMLAIARREVPQAEFHRIPIEDLQLDPGSVDLIVSFFAIIHIDRDLHAEIFRRMADWLRPGGAFLGYLGAGDNPDQSDDFHGVPMAWSHYGAETNVRLFREAGFDVVRSEIEDLGHERHLLMLAAKP